MNTFDPSDNNDQPPAKPARRVRYSGTHPKKFRQKYKEHNIEAHPDLEARLSAKGKTPASTHIPVLTEEVMASLKPAAGEIVADCILGYGGHAMEFIPEAWFEIAGGGDALHLAWHMGELDNDHCVQPVRSWPPLARPWLAFGN